MASPSSSSRSPPPAPPTLPPSSLRPSGSATTLHDLLNFPSHNYDVAPRPPPHSLTYGQPVPSMGYYSPYQAAHGGSNHPHEAHHQPPYAAGPSSAPAMPSSYQNPAGYLPFDDTRPKQKKARRDSIPSSLTSADDMQDQQTFASQTPVPQGSSSYQQPFYQQQQELEQGQGQEVVDVPDEVIAGLAGRQLTEKKRKWRAKAGVQGPGKSWRKGLKDADRPPAPPPSALPPPPPQPEPAAYIPAIEDVREGHYLEPDWRSPLPPKRRKDLTEKNRSRFVASAPAIKYNQAWITAEPLLNKGEAKTTPVRQWKIGQRMVRSITGLQWVSKNGWVGDTDSPLATLIQERKAAAAQAAAAALPPSLQPQSVAQTEAASTSGTPVPEGSSSALPPFGLAPVGATASQSPGPSFGNGSGGGMGIGMPHEKHRLYALARESEAGGGTSREGSVLSVGSDGTGL